ncbi:hypothetical protein B0H13DRAFT_1891017 [Mycena leptocephala]|nr:hypothetical protein B0H13DRAFT_1891017 [Mycena leptocephala]
MVSKLSVLVASVLIVWRSEVIQKPCCAIPTTIPVTPPTSDQCCGSVVDSSSTAAGKVLGLLGIDLGDITVPSDLAARPSPFSETTAEASRPADAPEIEWDGILCHIEAREERRKIWQNAEYVAYRFEKQIDLYASKLGHKLNYASGVLCPSTGGT